MGPWYSIICLKSKWKLNAAGYFLSIGLLIYLLGPGNRAANGPLRPGCGWVRCGRCPPCHSHWRLPGGGFYEKIWAILTIGYLQILWSMINFKQPFGSMFPPLSHKPACTNWELGSQNTWIPSTIIYIYIINRKKAWSSKIGSSRWLNEPK